MAEGYQLEPWQHLEVTGASKRSCTGSRRDRWWAQVDAYAPPPNKWRCQVGRRSRSAAWRYFRTWPTRDQALSDCDRILEAECSHRPLELPHWTRTMRGFGQLPRSVRRSDYRPRYRDTALVRVNLEKLLARHKRDEPQFAFSDRSSRNVINQRRIDASRQHLLDVLSGRWPATKLEPSHFLFDHGLLLVTDGRHRLVAARELGHRHVYVEVPREQVQLFRQLRGLGGVRRTR